MKLSTPLIVADLVEARNFYVDVMGLSIVHETEDRLDLKADSHEIHIFQGERSAKPYEHSSDASSTLVFWVENLALKMSGLESLGIKFIHSNENEYSKYAAFWGPSGIVHEISEVRT